MSNAIYQVIKENERLIYKLASKYTSHYNIEDLYQVGTIGVIKAYKKYKEDSSAKFSSYAYKYILGEMIEFIKNDRNIKVSEEYMILYKKYLSVKTLLTSKNGKEPSFKEICEFMQIDENYLLGIIETISFTVSTDDKEMFSYEFSSDTREEIDNKIILDEQLNELNDFDRSIIDFRYYQGLTQSETAEVLGITQVKVSRQEKLILQRMKQNIAA